MKNPVCARSRRRAIAVPTAIAIVIAAGLTAGCAMPPQMRIENANDPRYEDQDVRFRTTYYFRVYDPCPPTAAAPRPPASDTLYRFRMTGKSKSLTNQVHFEAGTLKATQIDPLGASVAYDERNRQFYLKSQADTQEDAQREHRLTEIERLVEVYRGFAQPVVPAPAPAAAAPSVAASAAASAVAAAASAAAAEAAGMAEFRSKLQERIVVHIAALSPRSGQTGGENLKAADAPSRSASSPEKKAANDCTGTRGFQILGPEGWREFKQDERLLMAMSSSGKPLIGTMQEIAGRVVNDQPIEAEMLLPLTREELRLTRAERELDRYDLSRPQTGVERLKAVIDALRREAK